MNKRLRIGIVSSADRPCGIWIYSEHERDGLMRHPASIEKVGFVAIDDKPREHDPSSLIATIYQNDVDSWARAVDEIAAWNPHIMKMNHEHGLNDPSFKAYGILAEELKKRGIPVVSTFHTIKYHPSQNEVQDTQSVMENSAGVIVLNKIAAKEIMEAGIYGPIDSEKVHYFPHPVRDIDVSPERREHLKAREGLAGRIVSGTQGFGSPNKGLDKLAIAIGEMWNSNDLTPTEKETFIHVQMGDYHPKFKEWKGGEPYRRFDSGIKTVLTEYGVPWKAFPGVNEFRGTDLDPFGFVFVEHTLNEQEYGDAQVMPNWCFLGNQDRDQAVTGVGIGSGTAGPLVATESLATRSELFLPTSRFVKPISAEEMDSGFIVAQSWAGVQGIREAYTKLIQDENLRNEMDSIGRSKRPTKTWEYVMGKQIEYFQTIL